VHSTPSSFPAPENMHPWIAEYLAGRLQPIPARLAATVVLLRDTADGPEAYLIKRATSMAFAGGRYAFPGGRVDPQDAEPAAAAWAGPSPEQWAARFDCPAADARALVAAAVRETFEETGVLLAGAAAGEVTGATASADWEADRLAVEAHELPLGALLDRRGLMLRTDLLAAWARWVTPVFEPRRYDTAFFVAALPAGQSAREVSGETEGTVWARPSKALADFAAGRVAMLPPTVTTLREIAAYDSVAAVLAGAATRSLSPIMAEVRAEPDGTYSLVWPLTDEDDAKGEEPDA
jgi:8-oxo-dGTP pyrophosphatase MutT (NUDIX family)